MLTCCFCVSKNELKVTTQNILIFLEESNMAENQNIKLPTGFTFFPTVSHFSEAQALFLFLFQFILLDFVFLLCVFPFLNLPSFLNPLTGIHWSVALLTVAGQLYLQRVVACGDRNFGEYDPLKWAQALVKAAPGDAEEGVDEKSKKQAASSYFPLRGKLCIVTGSNIGIGYQTALEMLQLGATVVLACRDAAKAQQAIKTLKHEVKAYCQQRLPAHLSQQQVSDAYIRVVFVPLDLSEIKSIDAFPQLCAAAVDRLQKDWIERGEDQNDMCPPILSQSSPSIAAAQPITTKTLAIDFLINNAGMFTAKNIRTHYGQDFMIGVNHLGPMRLTENLLSAVSRGCAGPLSTKRKSNTDAKSASSAVPSIVGGRIVILSSAANTSHRISKDVVALCHKKIDKNLIASALELTAKNPKAFKNCYGFSKLCNILYTEYLAMRSGQLKASAQLYRTRSNATSTEELPPPITRLPYTVVSCHPGGVTSNIFTATLGWMNLSAIQSCLQCLAFKSVQGGARTSVFCALAPTETILSASSAFSSSKSDAGGSYYFADGRDATKTMAQIPHREAEVEAAMQWSFGAMPAMPPDPCLDLTVPPLATGLNTDILKEKSSAAKSGRLGAVTKQ